MKVCSTINRGMVEEVSFYRYMSGRSERKKLRLLITEWKYWILEIGE